MRCSQLNNALIIKGLYKNRESPKLH